MSLIGKVLGNRYEILEEIGRGGMATVYKAKCKLLNRFVAVKVLKEEYAKDENFERRFRVEAQSAASLTHPNIVSVFDVGKENGTNYIVMELLEGFTLKDYIEKEGVLSNDVTIKLAIQIASALEAAHKAKIIHRDIKPQNIVLSRNMKEAKVTDFGIAKMTTSSTITNFGSTIGSVHYFSPEHAKGGYTDEKSDIYSLGVVMYEMATGQLPFNADTAVSVAIKQIQEEPIMPKEVNPKISDELNSIIVKAMQKNTANRYKNASEMVEELSHAIHGSYIKAKSDVSVSMETSVIPIIGMREITQNRRAVGEASRALSRKNNRLTEMEKNNEKELLEKQNVDDDDVKKVLKKDIIDQPKKTDENDLFGIDKRAVKRKKIIIFSVVAGSIFLILILGFLINIISKVKDNPVSDKVAPDLIGKVYETSKTEFKEKGININLTRYDYSSTIEEGKIISQSIDEGLALPDNSIYVIVSKGPKKITMIDEVGKDYTVAKYELEALGLVPVFTFVINAEVQNNIIISQDVKKGEIINVGDTINIEVSKGTGKTQVLVPNVTNVLESAAKKTLQDLKFKVSINYTEDKTKTNGIVLVQSQKENTQLDEGTLIDLTVNRITKSQAVNINIKDTIASALTKTPPATEPYTLKVVSKVEEKNTTLKETSVTADSAPISVTVNGYTTATLYIYINSILVETRAITL